MPFLGQKFFLKKGKKVLTFKKLHDIISMKLDEDLNGRCRMAKKAELKLNQKVQPKRWEFHCHFDDRMIAKNAHFRFDFTNKVWYTEDQSTAYALSAYADEEVKKTLENECKPVLNAVEGGWVLECSYSDKEVAKKAGFWWQRIDKRWFTADPECAMRVVQFAILSEVREAVEAAFTSKEQKLKASRATSTTNEFPTPQGLEYLPFQKAGIEFSLQNANTLIGDEMGLGKTIQAVGVINADQTIKKVLVICPSFLKRNWSKEISKWSVRPLTVEIIDGSSWVDADVQIINYDILSRHSDRIRAEQYDLIVIDEVQYCKNPKALRTAYALGGKIGKKGEEQEIAPIPARRRVYLTGTPLLNRPVELWSILHSLDPETFKNFMSFAKRYCGAYQDRYAWHFDGATNLDELQKKLRSSVMIRRMKADVLKELPAKRRQIIELPANGAAGVVSAEKKAYERYQSILLELQVAVELSKASDNPSDYEEAVKALKEGYVAAFTEISAQRHEVALAKVPYVIEHVRSILEEGKKVVVFAHHIDVAEAIAEGLRQVADGVVIHSKVNNELRDRYVTRFQTEDDCKWCVGTIGAAGVGLTMTASSHVVFAELDWVPANLSQAEDRCHRIGQVESVLIQHLVLEGSLDAHIAETIVEKQRIIDRALNDEVELNTEPVLPIHERVDTKSFTTRKEIDQLSKLFTPERIRVIHSAILEVALYCDGARTEDRVGFNKFDAAMGKRLAAQGITSSKQAAVALKLVYKYRRQISGELVSILENIMIEAGLKKA